MRVCSSYSIARASRARGAWINARHLTSSRNVFISFRNIKAHLLLLVSTLLKINASHASIASARGSSSDGRARA